MKIKEAQEGDRRQVQEKEALIEEISALNDQLQR